MQEHGNLYSVVASIEETLVKVVINVTNKSLINKPIFTFWVPIASLDEYGFVPADIIRSRFKHRFKTHLGNFSYTTN